MNEAVARSSPVFLALLDRDLRILSANRQKPEDSEPSGLSVLEIVAPACHDALRAAIEEVRASGCPEPLNLDISGADGQLASFSCWVVPLAENAPIASIAIVGFDAAGGVSPEGSASEQLAQSEERFRTLVEYAPEAMVILDVDSGRFVAASANACRLFGLTRQELLQRGPPDVSPERQPDGERTVDAAKRRIQQATQGTHTVFEWTHCDADGKIIPCEVRLIRLPHAKRRWVRGSVIDISERKRAEEERQRLTMDLAQAQKMQAIGQLTGGVAHDFNNLLTMILGSATMIDKKADSPELVREHAQQVLAAARRAAGLTQRLLAFARRQPLRPSVVTVDNLVAGMEDLLRRTLGETVAVETHLGAGSSSCEIDAAQLENAILNLAINARDAMPNGGRLTIETTAAVVDRHDARRHGELEPGDYTVLSITDTGIGMSAQVLSNAFEPFFTTKESGRGSGLGLSMVYGFVKQSGGHVEIASNPGEGTSVKILLPRSTLGAAGPEPVQQPEPIPSPGDGRVVLVVEDEAGVRSLVVKHLENLGYRALDAADVDGALELLSVEPSIALVVSDVILPGGKNGAELAERAHAMRPDLPVLFMSGYTEDALIHNGRLDPDVSLLQKPFTQCELAIAVQNAIASQ